MSKISDFTDATYQAGTRTKGYVAQPNITNNEQAHWSNGNSNVPSFQGAPQSVEKEVKPNISIGSFEDQIKRVLTNHYRYIGQTPRRVVIENQVKLMSSYYRALKKLKFDIQDVTTFGLRHAKALLHFWQAKDCSPNTIYCRWSVLRSWTRALGKHGMLGTINDVQPDFDRNTLSTVGIRTLTSDQIQKRSDFLGEKPDLTVYLVDRLCREIRITREEALTLGIDAINAALRDDSYLIRTSLGNQRKNTPLTKEDMNLIGRVAQYMESRNRKTLGWSGLDLDAALQKYTLRLAYVTRTLFPDARRGYKPSSQEDGAA